MLRAGIDPRSTNLGPAAQRLKAMEEYAKRREWTIAEFERDISRERIKAGIDQSRMNGKPHGRPRSALNKTSEIAKLHAEGVSKSKIASTLGIGRTSVRRILRQPPADALKTGIPTGSGINYLYTLTLGVL